MVFSKKEKKRSTGSIKFLRALSRAGDFSLIVPYSTIHITKVCVQCTVYSVQCTVYIRRQGSTLRRGSNEILGDFHIPLEIPR